MALNVDDVVEKRVGEDGPDLVFLHEAAGGVQLEAERLGREVAARRVDQAHAEDGRART